MSSPHFAALEAFVQAAETGSFKEAGRRLGISSSAIGRTIARLEAGLEVRLFYRSTRAIALTAEGEKFLVRCHRIFAEYEAAREEMGEVTTAPVGRLRVGFPSMGTEMMHHIIAFQSEYPEIELDLDFSDRLVNVVEEGFDVVMRIGTVEDSRLRMRRLKGFRHQLVATPAYIARYGHPQQVSDLTAHRCLRYRYPTTGRLSPWTFLHNGQSLRPELPQSAVANNVSTLLSMVMGDQGIALLPDLIVSENLKACKLTAIFDACVYDERAVSLLWPSSRQYLPKVRVFVQFMASRLERELA